MLCYFWHIVLCTTYLSLKQLALLDCLAGCKMIADRLVTTSSFRVLVTSRQLPPTPRLRKVGEFGCAYSWNLGGVAHVYTRNDLAVAPPSVLSNFLAVDGVAWLPHNRTIHVPIVAEESLLHAVMCGDQTE